MPGLALFPFVVGNGIMFTFALQIAANVLVNSENYLFESRHKSNFKIKSLYKKMTYSMGRIMIKLKRHDDDFVRIIFKKKNVIIVESIN